MDREEINGTTDATYVPIYNDSQSGLWMIIQSQLQCGTNNPMRSSTVDVTRYLSDLGANLYKTTYGGSYRHLDISSLKKTSSRVMATYKIGTPGYDIGPCF